MFNLVTILSLGKNKHCKQKCLPVPETFKARTPKLTLKGSRHADFKLWCKSVKSFRHCGKENSSFMSSVKVGKERIILNLYLYRFLKVLSCVGNILSFYIKVNAKN